MNRKKAGKSITCMSIYIILINIFVMAEKPQEQPKPDQGRGFGRGGPKGGKGRPERKKEEAVWNPVTKLGRLVKGKLIENLNDIFRFSIPIKEMEIVD